MADQTQALLKRLLREVVEGRQSIEARIEGVDQRADRFRDETLANFDGVYQRISILDSELQATRAGLERRLEQFRHETTSNFNRVDQQIARVESRLAALEKQSAAE